MKQNSKTVLKGLLSPLLLLALVFLPAGRFGYWQGWIYVALSVVILAATVIVLRDKADLIQERLSPGKGMKWWDKLYFCLSTPLSFGSIVLASLDVGRYHWTTPLSEGPYVLALIVFCLGHGIFLWAKRENKFFSSVVRIQTDRGQNVCNSGPYAFVRHPGYAGGILFAAATPFVLGSAWVWAWLPAIAAALLLIPRTMLEDRTLRRELPGYADYSQKVRFRLLPNIW